MPYPDIPKLDLPIRYDGNGNLAAVEQDDEDEIMNCIEVILRYPVGQRDELPEFGVDDPVFAEGGADLDEIAIAIERWEPRADFSTDEDFSKLDRLIDHVTINLEGSTSG